MLAKKYAQNLYGNDLEGYIQILQLENGKVIKMLNSTVDGLVDVIEQQEGQKDTYITPNSFYIPKRSNDNIRHFRALYIDLDLKEYTKSEAFYQIYLKSAQEKIPKPSMIIDSGRGLHCYWAIDHAPKGALYTWQELEDYFYKQLKDIGADIKATDSARLMRLPSTINSRNNQTCCILEDNKIKYSMYDLREKYLNYVKEDKPKTSKTYKKTNVKNLFNSYTLHLARAQDIETLARLRNYNVVGYRNSLTHLFSYWKGIYIRDDQELYNVVDEFNDKLKAPLKQTEIRAIVRSTQRAIEKFIDYEQGVRSGDKKRVSKAMRERGGYWYTNKRLIDMLDITDQEQKHLKTIISKDEKLRRQKAAKRNARRNENGLTSREQKKLDNIKAVKELSKKNLTQKQIAKELGITQQYVSSILNI